MTLKPIPGAPIDAPVPDFPTGEPGPLVLPVSRFTRAPVGPAPLTVTSSAPSATESAARRPGPVEIRGDGDSILTFRCIPEVPAINRSSLTISITGEAPGEHSAQRMPKLDLPIDEAKAFLLALHNGESPVVIADSRTAFQLEFAILEDGPTFTIGQLGQVRTSRRFNAGSSHDVKEMATHLLAELGP
jgi:hypothetical protein